MATRNELANQIRYQMSILGEANRHHDFEHLCRDLARRRICSNILPATGPVTAGGDQGRDAETFRTYLRNSDIRESTFLGLATDAVVAFAFTTQTDRIPAKVKSDAAKITSAGSEVDSIFFFCTVAVPVRRRHELQAEILESHGVHLEIWDGPAIAEHLADPDTFWIATEYLGIPRELFPVHEGGDPDSWYSDYLMKYQTQDSFALTYGNFFEVREGLRYSTLNPERFPDFNFWIETVKRFRDDDADSGSALHYRSIYELAYASIRSQKSLHPFDGDVRRYFEAVCNNEIGLERFSDFEDASVLMMMCGIAVHEHATSISLSELTEWRHKLLNELDRRISDMPTAAMRCQYLMTKGHIRVLDTTNGEPSIEEAFDAWLELLESVGDAPLFPIERLANILTVLVPILGNAPRYDELTNRVDELVAQRSGDAAAAQKCRERAAAFLKGKNFLRAIGELHDAKIRWFAKETLPESVAAMGLIAKAYETLGLHYAAKYYAMAAAWIAATSEQPNILAYMPRLINQAAEQDYVLGNWISFLGLTGFAARAHMQFLPDLGEDDPSDIDSFWTRSMYHCSVVLAVAEANDPEFVEFVSRSIDQSGLSELVEEALPNARDMIEKLSEKGINESVIEQNPGIPFADVGSRRRSSWTALGIEWALTWQNNFDSNAIAEQFAAVMQIAISDIAKFDLHTISTKIDIEVTVQDVNEPILVNLSSNEGRRWKVTLPKASSQNRGDIFRYNNLLMGYALDIISEVSLLVFDEFNSLIEDLLRSGMSNKTFVVSSYEFLYKQFTDQADVELFNEATFDRPDWSVGRESHVQLAWRSDLSPKYSREDSLLQIERRYSKTPSKFPVTLARLRNDSAFRSTLATLRARGWKDWHILLAVANVATNSHREYYLGNFPPPGMSREEANRIIMELVDSLRAESEHPVPLTEFSAENLEFHLNIAMFNTPQNAGLEVRQEAPDIEAVRHFLEYRFNYWEDDVEHEDPFGNMGDDPFWGST